jgi:hypothetical protein
VDGWLRRRPGVTFPPGITTHSAEQVFYFDENALLRRIDYAPYVTGGAPAAHYVEAHETVSGLVFTTRRHVRRREPGGVGVKRIITLDIADLGVEFAD